MKNTDQNDDPADMADGAVNEELARLRDWRDVCKRGKYIVGHDPDRPEHWPPVPIPNYCSPDAPHSFRVALVEAVIKAGAMMAFVVALSESEVDCVPGDACPEWRTAVKANFKSGESHTGAYGLFMGLMLPSPVLVRAALTALRAAGSGKEQEGNES